MIEKLSIIFYIISIVLYLTAFGLFLSRFTSEKDTSILGNKFLIAGLVSLTAALVLRFFAANMVFSFHPFEIFAVISWFLVLEALVVEFWSGIKILGFYISPFAASMLLFGWSQYMAPGPSSVTETILKNNWVLTHANLIFIAYGAFIVGAGSSVLYLIQEKQIKNRKSTKIMRYLPSLNILEEASFRSVAIGFTVLTIALGIGISFAVSHPEGWDPSMVIASIFAWVVFLFYLYARIKLGWLGRKSAYVIIFGLIVILVIHFGVAAYLVTSHKYIVG